MRHQPESISSDVSRVKQQANEQLTCSPAPALEPTLEPALEPQLDDEGKSERIRQDASQIENQSQHVLP